jgi:hypothetical protein
VSYDPNHYTDCCHEGCYATICLSPKNYHRLKRTGEWFYCPAGHQQHFTGKTDDQKEIDRLQTSLRRTTNKLGRAAGQRDKAIAMLRRCPVCLATPPRYLRIYRAHWWRYDDDLAAVREWLIEHLRTEHGAKHPESNRESV